MTGRKKKKKDKDKLILIIEIGVKNLVNSSGNYIDIKAVDKIAGKKSDIDYELRNKFDDTVKWIFTYNTDKNFPNISIMQIGKTNDAQLKNIEQSINKAAEKKEKEKQQKEKPTKSEPVLNDVEYQYRVLCVNHYNDNYMCSGYKNDYGYENFKFNNFFGSFDSDLF